MGVPIVISSDAHSTAGLGVLRYGILQARRAGLTARDVANTIPRDEFLQLVAKGRGSRDATWDRQSVERVGAKWPSTSSR